MSRESKVLIGVGGLAALGLILAVTGMMAIGLVLLALGLVAGVVALRVTKPDTTDPFAEARSEADQSNTGTLTPNDPLAPWAPTGGLNAWTPPADLAPPAPPEAPYATPAFDAPAYDPPIYEPPAAPQPAETTSWDDTTWDSTVTWEAEPTPSAPAPQAPAPPAPAAFEPPAPPAYSPPPPSYTPPAPADHNPLDDLVGLDALDPIAEVERIENREAGTDTGFEGFEPFDAGRDVHTTINENVTGADDIMAASQATELNLADGEQTELQKLLAKVQIRLSAYE